MNKLKRSSKEIMIVILKNLAKKNGKGIAKSRLSSISNISPSMAYSYFKVLINSKLIEEREPSKTDFRKAKTHFFITPLGKEFLFKYEGSLNEITKLENQFLKWD